MDPISTKSRLLDAATRVFLAHGFHAASMDLVRQEAGVSNGSLYHHYPTKALLADALYAHTLRDFHATLLVPIAGRAGAQAGVKGIIRAYLEWVVRHPERARLLHELRRSGLAEGGAEMTAANDDGFGALAVWVARRTEAGEMRAMPFPIWMALVFAPAISLTPHWASQPEPTISPKVRAALEHAAWMAVAS
jgi:AcrR family transcriptional regulator